MSDPLAGSQAGQRRALSFPDVNAAIADVRALRCGYVKTSGTWTLEQVAWHLARTTFSRMTPGTQPTEDSPEQIARRGVLAEIMRTGRLPDAQIVAPDHLLPPADPGLEAIDDLIFTLERLRDFDGTLTPHRLFGRQSDADARKQILIHVAHHLSFLVPMTRVTETDQRASTGAHRIDFHSEAEVAEHVRRLRLRPVLRSAGKWTLAQACWHINIALDRCLHAPSTTTPNDAQQEMRPRLAGLIAARSMPRGLDAPVGTEPPASADDHSINSFLAGLNNLAAYKEAFVDFGPFGPTRTEDFRQFIFIHSAHHLQLFEPN